MKLSEFPPQNPSGGSDASAPAPGNDTSDSGANPTPAELQGDLIPDDGAGDSNDDPITAVGSAVFRKLRVLVADDEIITRTKICSLIEKEGYEVIACADGAAAIELAQKHRPDLILLDVVMPNTDGFQALEAIKKEPALRDTPVFMLTVRDSPKERVRGFDMGARDYIIKPFSAEELVCRMKLAMRQSGEQRETSRRLNQLQELNRSLAEMVGGRTPDAGGQQPIIDGTTDLPAMSAFMPEVVELLDYSSEVAILYVNLSKNDIIEANHGVGTCDDIMRDVSRALEDFLSSEDLGAERVQLARYGGDDFLVFLGGLDKSGEQHIERLGHALEDFLKSRLREHFAEEIPAILEFFVGHAQVKRDDRVRVDRQIFRGVKRAQRDATDMVKHDLDKKKSQLRKCLREELLHPVYQPIVEVGDEPQAKILGYEVLTRGDLQGFTNPQILFDVAEMSGLVWELSRIVRKLAIEPVRFMKDHELLFINMHPADFSDPQFLGSEIWGDEYSRISHRIVFEITERAAIHDYDLFKDYLGRVRELGYRVAVDDLGSGYSGLTSLAVLEPDFIKFDKSLIRDIDKIPVKQNLVKTMIAFAEDTGARVVGEGVETASEADCLADLGCHYLQGYYFARPGRPFPQVDQPVRKSAAVTS